MKPSHTTPEQALAKCDHVFVYGSLLKGLHNHQVLSRHAPEFIGPGKTAGDWFMAELCGGAYPGISPADLVLDPNSREFAKSFALPVMGECYRVTCASGMAALDRLESYPGYYDRRIERIEIIGGDFELMQTDAWIYFVDFLAITERHIFEGRNPVEGNDWRKHYARKNPGYLRKESAGCVW